MCGRTVLLTALVVGLGGALPRPAPQIAFVDVVAVGRQYKAHRQLAERVRKEYEKKRAALRQRMEQLDQRYRKELPLYERGSKEYEALLIELRVEEERIKLELQAEESRWKRKQLLLTEDFLKAVSEAVAAEAQARGLQAVFMHRPLQEVRTLEDLFNLQNQWVLYHDRTLDLTAAVVQRLNGAAGGGKAEKGKPQKE